jgi:hypothetical protein
MRLGIVDIGDAIGLAADIGLQMATAAAAFDRRVGIGDGGVDQFVIVGLAGRGGAGILSHVMLSFCMTNGPPNAHVPQSIE